MLNGKTALVTGGSSGIGLEAARALQGAGARVAIIGTDAGKLDRARDWLGTDVVAIRADVTSPTDLKHVCAELERRFTSVDILFANAGIAYGTPIATTDEAAYDRLMNVNVKGVFFTVQAMLPIMADGASIILNTSWLNKVGTPGRAVLAASKAAVRSFARTLSAELLDRRIRVNAVSPGPIDTPIHRSDGQSEEEYQAYTDRVGARIPVGHMGATEDIAAAVLFLAGEGSRFMRGAEIIVDGGLAEL